MRSWVARLMLLLVAAVQQAKCFTVCLHREDSFRRPAVKTSASTPFTIERVGECLGSGSYGTVHLLYVKEEPDDVSSVPLVGKRPFSRDELQSQNATLDDQQLDDKSARCRYYWRVEQHCFTKIILSAETSPIDLGVPFYRGVASDDRHSWMLFEPLSSRDETTPLQSLQEYLEQDIEDHRSNENHHLFLTGRALGQSSLLDTLDVVMTQLLETLSHVHERSIVHRDIKPSNLLVVNERLYLIDFGSAADLETAGLLKENIGLGTRVAVSPIYAAPEVFVDPSNKHALSFDCFSAALLFCQLLFQYLDERTESGFHQQLSDAQYDLDTWLANALQSKVRPYGLEDALDVLQNRPGLWKLLQKMFVEDPRDRISSRDALGRWRTILEHSSRIEQTTDDPDLLNGPYLQEILDTLDLCDVSTIRPLHFVASFQRKSSLGLILAESDAETDDMDASTREQWEAAVSDAQPGEVFVKGVVPLGQADEMGVFETGDRLQGVGELPVFGVGFEKVVEMLQDQPRSAKYVTLHFDRKPATSTESDVGKLPIPALEGPVQVHDQGAWSIRGRRKAQEDAYLLHELHDTKERSVLLAGILDGHLGTAASQFVQEELPLSFSAGLNSGDKRSVEQILESSWDDCCDAYRAACSESECVADYDPREGVLSAFTGGKDAVAGTTASLFALDKQTGRLTFLNCGDSRGLAIDGQGILQFQTVDHKPETEIERLTAGKEHGLDYSVPTCSLGRWKVEVGEYDYAVARSLEGPFATSKGLTSKADVHTIQAEPSMTLVVASDGLWEKIDSLEAGRMAHRLREQNVSAGDAAKALCKSAYDKSSSDNISVVVVYLD